MMYFCYWPLPGSVIFKIKRVKVTVMSTNQHFVICRQSHPNIRYVSHLVHLHVISTLCNGSETLLEWKCESITDLLYGLTGVGARDACASKNVMIVCDDDTVTVLRVAEVLSVTSQRKSLTRQLLHCCHHCSLYNCTTHFTPMCSTCLVS